MFKVYEMKFSFKITNNSLLFRFSKETIETHNKCETLCSVMIFLNRKSSFKVDFQNFEHKNSLFKL
jgi:hypothetical protein